jgi:hypothetical protein
VIVSEKVTKATGTEAQSDYFRKSGKGNRHKSAKWLFQKKWQKKQAQKHRVIISEKVAKATGTVVISEKVAKGTGTKAQSGNVKRSGRGNVTCLRLSVLSNTLCASAPLCLFPLQHPLYPYLLISQQGKAERVCD